MAQLGEGRDDQTNRREHEHDESTTNKRFSLHDLTHDDNPHQLFISEIQRIFQYGMKDILETISELDMDVLSSIHNTLANMAKTNMIDRISHLVALITATESRRSRPIAQISSYEQK